MLANFPRDRSEIAPLSRALSGWEGSEAGSGYLVMMSRVVLTFLVYDEANWRALERPRLEFRGAGGKRCRGEDSQRGDRHRDQQSTGCAGDERAKARGIATRLIPSKGLAAGSVRPPGGGGAAGIQGGSDLPGGLHAIVVALFCGGLSAEDSEHSPVAAAVVSGAGIAEAGAGPWREVRWLHGAFCGRESGRGADHRAGGRAGADSDDEHALSERILKEEHRIYS